jgi:hypothetical protein
MSFEFVSGCGLSPLSIAMIEYLRLNSVYILKRRFIEFIVLDWTVQSA